jgi:cell division protein FtsZ
MTLAEANSVAKKISEKMDVNNAMVIWGARVNDEFDGYLRVMLLITGIKSPQIFGKKVSSISSFNENILPKNLNESKLSNDILNIRELSID